MDLLIQCPNSLCGESYAVDETSLGGRFECRKCGETFTLNLSLVETVPGGSGFENPASSRLQPASSDQIEDPDGIDEASAMAAAARISEPPPEKIGPYLVQRRLGGGAIGEVWLAHDADLQRDTAIKTLRREYSKDAEYLQRFLREARSAARLHHTNVVTTYQVGAEGDVVYIAMEVVDGGSLDQTVADGRPMDWREASHAIRDAAVGLAAAHEAGLVHRDVKPANLMRTSKGVTKVADFGLARGRAADSQLTQHGMLLGTPAYLAPEIWMGQEADDRSDLYSLIITYYHLLTGALPFHAPNLPSIGYQHRYEPFPDPRQIAPRIPDAACRVLTRGSSKDRGQRYRNGHEVAADLDALLSVPDEQLTFGAAWEDLGGQACIAQEDRSATVPRPATIFAESGAEEQIESRGQSHRALALLRRVRSHRRLIAASGIAVTVLVVAAAIANNRLTTTKNVPRDQAAKVPARVATGNSAPRMATAPFDAATAKEYQAAWAAYLRTPIETTNSIGMALVLVPPGEFTMGSPITEPDRHPNESPDSARIARPFHMGVYEVTQGQYLRVMGDNPSFFGPTGEGKAIVNGFDTSNYPVECVSLEDAADFCRKLSERPEEEAAGRAYRLPTEVEWEYACRAGTTAPFHFGLQLNGKQANCNGNLPFGTDVIGPYLERTTAVGSYSANAFGLFDMHGNVREWCQDWVADDKPDANAAKQTGGPTLKSVGARRGGAWSTDAASCRAAHRYRSEPPYSGNYLGFRVVMVIR